jgi:hypothetical protein
MSTYTADVAGRGVSKVCSASVFLVVSVRQLVVLEELEVCPGLNLNRCIVGVLRCIRLDLVSEP